MIVPYFASFLGAIGVILTNLPLVSDAIVERFLRLSAVVFVLALTVSARDGNYSEHLRTAALFLYSFGVGYATYIGLVSVGRKQTETTFFWIFAILTLGAMLEVYGPLAPASDWFRETFEGWKGLYESFYRDVAQYGAYRPKFFASEPSLLALSVGIAFSLWIGSRKTLNWAIFAASILLLAAGMFFIRSPNLLFGPLVLLLTLIYPKKKGSSLLRAFRTLLFLGYMGVSLALPAISLYVVINLPRAPHYMLSLSYFERIIAPFLMFAEMLRSAPLFGIGLGNNTGLTSLGLMSLSSTGILALVPENLRANFGNLISNVSWLFWINFGLLGGLIVIWTISDFIKTLRVPLPGLVVFSIAAGTFWQGFGGVNTPLTWSTFFVVAALATFSRGDGLGSQGASNTPKTDHR